jgi:hypothetical protein
MTVITEGVRRRLHELVDISDACINKLTPAQIDGILAESQGEAPPTEYNGTDAVPHEGSNRTEAPAESPPASPPGETKANGHEPSREQAKRDANDIHCQYGADVFREMFDKAEPISIPTPKAEKPVKYANKIATVLAGIKTATALQTMTFPQLKYIVPDLIVEGCVLLAHVSLLRV